MPRIVEAFWDAELGPVPGIDGTNGADSLWGTDADDHIYGHGGNDRLKGYGGADWLDGGTGIDTVYYADSTAGVAVNLATGHGYGGSAEGDRLVSIEYVFGSFHNDTITGNDANNELYGLTGNDVLKGGGGADGLAGDDGDDILKGGGGADYLEGGAGIDTVDYSASEGTVNPYGGFFGVSVNLNENQAFRGDAEGDTFSGIEHVIGTPYRDTLIGTGDNNLLRGLEGDDHLQGNGGNDRLEGDGGTDSLMGGEGDDTLRGDLGDDQLSGESGVDTMIGGDGNDRYYIVNDANDVVIEFGGQGNDDVWSAVSWTLTPGADVETLRALTESASDPINLTGNASGNTVLGNNGNNVLNGGAGNDFLTGRGGQDSFLFDTALSAATNVDLITDFDQDDTIMLENTIFAAFAAGPLAAERFVVGPAALEGNDTIIYNPASGALFYDVDGSGAGAAIQFATLPIGFALTENDFLIV